MANANNHTRIPPIKARFFCLGNVVHENGRPCVVLVTCGRVGLKKERKKEGYSLHETSKPAGLGKGRMYAALSSRLNPWLQGQIGATFYRCTWANLLERPVHAYNVGLMNWKGIRSSFMRRYPIFMQLKENGVGCVWLERWWGRKVWRKKLTVAGLT